MAKAKSIRERRVDEQQIPRRVTCLSDVYDMNFFVGSRTLASSLRPTTSTTGKRNRPYPNLSQVDMERDG
jgi:hypothetical protein